MALIERNFDKNVMQQWSSSCDVSWGAVVRNLRPNMDMELKIQFNYLQR